VLVVTRYTVPEQAGREFYAKAKSAIKVLAAQPGYVRGRIGRATDEPLQWVIVTEWQNVGAYRRAIGTYTARVEAVPLLALARDEPTAYEILYADRLDPEGGTAEWGATAPPMPTASAWARRPVLRSRPISDTDSAYR
jgi:hypothetical protein